MSDINVFENGIGYLAACLSMYLGGCGYLILYLAAAVYLIKKGSDEEREIFLPATILLMLTVYNPLFPVVLDKIFDVSSEYYRFFWITPIIVLVPFVASKLVENQKSIKEKAVVIAFLIVVCACSGRIVYERGIPLAQNVYKIPDELIEIDEVIHADCDKEYTKAFFEYEYNMEIRQYDPKILLAIDREEYIYAVNYSYTDEMIYDDNVPTNRMLASLFRNQDVDAESLRQAFESTHTEYAVITKGSNVTRLLERAGLRLIGDTATHLIYRYDLMEPYEFELVDYSDAEHMLSYRRLK